MRPSDLPQPVREHVFRENHQDRWRSEASPGPARYSGSGVTVFERNTLLGTFGKDSRFKKGQLVPGDNFSAAERSSFLEGAGPKYNPKFLDTRLSTSFTSTSHSVRAKDNGIPGPGAYDANLAWDRGVSIPNSHRTTRSANNTPGPGAYSPSKPPIRTRGAFIGTSSSLDTSNAESRKIDKPPIASLEAIDRSMQTTRSASPSISFTKSERKLILAHGEVNPNGAGAYDTNVAEKVIMKKIKGGSFGTSSRMPNRKPDTDAKLLALPPADVTSTHARSPSVGFTKAAPQRGIPDTIKEHASVPTAKYNPSYAAVQPSVKGVVGWGKPRVGKGRTDLTPSVTSDVNFIEAKSTVVGPAISFTESKRPMASANNTPGPGAYTPTLKAPKREARAAGFPKAKRELVSGIVGENTPGPIYNPDISASRAPIVPEISMPKTNRKTEFFVSTAGADAAYDPKYSQVDKNTPAAILYLTE